jgi:hypothetical protein
MVELIAARSRNGVAFSEDAHNPVRHSLDQLVPEMLSHFIIDQFQVVEAEEQYRERLGVSLGKDQRLRQTVIKDGFARKSCRGIAIQRMFLSTSHVSLLGL